MSLPSLIAQLGASLPPEKHATRCLLRRYTSSQGIGLGESATRRSTLILLRLFALILTLLHCAQVQQQLCDIAGKEAVQSAIDDAASAAGTGWVLPTTTVLGATRSILVIAPIVTEGSSCHRMEQLGRYAGFGVAVRFINCRRFREGGICDGLVLERVKQSISVLRYDGILVMPAWSWWVAPGKV